MQCSSESLTLSNSERENESPVTRDKTGLSIHNSLAKSESFYYHRYIRVTYRCVTCLLPLGRHCPSSGSFCPAGGRGCPRVQCARSGRGSGDHSPGSCSPSPPSPSSPRQSSPRWAPRTSSSRALRSGVRWAQ